MRLRQIITLSFNLKSKFCDILLVIRTREFTLFLFAVVVVFFSLITAITLHLKSISLHVNHKTFLNILKTGITRCVCETRMSLTKTKSKMTIFRIKVKIKVTGSLTLVPFERVSLAKYTYQI